MIKLLFSFCFMILFSLSVIACDNENDSFDGFDIHHQIMVTTNETEVVEDLQNVTGENATQMTQVETIVSLQNTLNLPFEVGWR